MIGILIGLAVLAGAAFGPAGIAIIAIFGLTGLQLGWLRPLPAILLVIVAAAGFARANGASTRPVIPSWTGTPHAFYATVSNSPASDGSARRFIAEVKPASRAATETAIACVSAPVAPRVARGDRLYFVADVRTEAQATPSFAAFMHRSGCSIAMTTYAIELLAPGSGLFPWLDRIRERMSERVQRAIPGDAGALVSGLATGDDAALSSGARNAFFGTGTSHVTAVSGSNLALFIAVFAMAGAAAGWLRTLVWQLATVSIIWLYVAFRIRRARGSRRPGRHAGADRRAAGAEARPFDARRAGCGGANPDSA